MATGNEILQELREMGSPLADCRRNMPYELPADYLENLPGVLWEKVERNVTLSKEMPHIVPGGYFDNLAGNILQKAGTGQKAATPSVHKRTRLIPLLQWVAAAMLIVAIGMGSYRFLNPAQMTVEQQLQALSDDALLSYVEDNLYAFETETIAEHISTKGLSSSPLELNDEAIEDYLEYAGWQ